MYIIEYYPLSIRINFQIKRKLKERGHCWIGLTSAYPKLVGDGYFDVNWLVFL
jgi:hypothetical protein